MWICCSLGMFTKSVIDSGMDLLAEVYIEL